MRTLFFFFTGAPSSESRDLLSLSLKPCLIDPDGEDVRIDDGFKALLLGETALGGGSCMVFVLRSGAFEKRVALAGLID